MTQGTGRLLAFVAGMTRLVSQAMQAEADMLGDAERLMRQLVAHDDWLPEPFAVPHAEFYRQYLLYGDPLDRFSVVSFVWGPGQATPVHDHTVWGVIGMLRGAEFSSAYQVDPHDGRVVPAQAEERLEPGQTLCVSPSLGDVHRVRNAFVDRTSISVHVYGGNIGRVQRHVFDPATGLAKPFVSGYSGDVVANLWA